MNFDDYEQLPTPSTFTNMIAGGAAGVLEHCVMYPMDSIKVRYLILFSDFFFLLWNWVSIFSDQNAEPFANNIQSNTSQHTEIHDQIRGHFKVNNNIHFKVQKSPLMKSYRDSALSDSNQMNISSFSSVFCLEAEKMRGKSVEMKRHRDFSKIC